MTCEALPGDGIAPCAYCRGEGTIGCIPCPACGGTATVPVGRPAVKCSSCGGFGVAGCCRCSTCGGTGWKAPPADRTSGTVP